MVDSHDDELLTGLGWPAWTRWVGGVGVAALVLALLAVKLASHQHAAPSASPSVSSSASSSASPPGSAAAIPLAATAPYVLPVHAAPTDDVLTDGNALFAVQGRLLLRREGLTWQQRTVSDAGASDPLRRLMIDPDTQTIWIVEIGGGRPAQLAAFDEATLRPLGTVHWPRPVVAAVPVRGSLYVADATGLFRVTVDGAATTMDVPWARDILGLTADPRRDRTLVLIGNAGRTELAVLGEVRPVPAVLAPSGLVKATLGVTADEEIWLAGYSSAGAVLELLDPRTLRPAVTSALVTQLGSGAVLLASGTSAILVDGGDGDAQVWCVDASDGTPTRRWAVAAQSAAMTQDLAVAVGPSGAVRLGLGGGCSG